MKNITKLICLLSVAIIFETVLGQEPKMALIPAGDFLMGKDSEKGANFSPAHLVSVDSFYMDKYEVTNGEYFEFCKATEHKLPEFWNTELFHSGEDFLNYPVVGINWRDANKYAIWAGKRLPTEAEWEYAARGGLIQNEYPNGNEWTKPRARQKPDSGWKNLIEPVGAYKPNAYGLYDMGGNVWEWTTDKYRFDYYAESPSSNPKGPEFGDSRVIRGGGWHSGPMCKRVYFRKGLPPGWCDFAVGFRCVKDVH